MRKLSLRSLFLLVALCGASVALIQGFLTETLSITNLCVIVVCFCWIAYVGMVDSLPKVHS